MTVLSQISRANDGARILWRYFQAADDTRANEGHVREFTKAGDYVRIAPTCFKDDNGEWLRIADLRLVAVLEEHAEVKERPKPQKKPRKHFPGEGWKDEDTGDLDLGGGS